MKPSTARRPKPDTQQTVDAFNAKFPVGSPVWYSEVMRPAPAARQQGFTGSTERTPTVTRSEAWLMGGHSAMVMLEGKSGGVCCSHVEAREESREKRLEKNLQQFLDFLNTLPPGWLGKTVADIGLLNDAYVEARRLGMKVDK